MMRRSLGSVVFAASLGAVGLAFAVGGTGCAPVLSADQATQQHGTRPYPGRGTAEVVEATRTALLALGYVIVSEAEALPIKTAPKIVQVNATASAGSASAAGAELAWTIEFGSDGETPVVIAHPRGYFAGQVQEKFNAAWVEGAFDTLFGEIDASLPSKTAETAELEAPGARIDSGL
jgi:hypothetical protein